MKKRNRPKKAKPKKAKPSIDTVDQLHEYFNKKVNQYMNEPLSKPDWNAQMAHTMMTAIYSYSQHLYNDDKPKTRLGLSEHVDRYCLFTGQIVTVKRFKTKAGFVYRALILNPLLVASLYDNPKTHPYKEDGTVTKAKQFDTHIWVDLKTLSYDKTNLNLRTIMVGETLAFSAKVIVYRGKVDLEYKRVGKYGITDSYVIDTSINYGNYKINPAYKPDTSKYTILVGKDGKYRYNKTHYDPKVFKEIDEYDESEWFDTEKDKVGTNLAVKVAHSIGIYVIQRFDKGLQQAIDGLLVYNKEVDSYEYVDKDKQNDPKYSKYRPGEGKNP